MPDSSSFSAQHDIDHDLDFTDEELDVVYAQLSAPIRQQIDAETLQCLTEQNYSNIRQGSATWLRVQRRIMQAKLAESQQRQTESEMGV